MVKYVDAGYEDPASSGPKKKKSKKGFKADRRANYERMMTRKYTGKDTKQPADKRPTRTKSIVFDDAARRDYLLTLHKKKNERRVQAFVDTKKKMRKDNARTRQQQREEARRAYNNYARVPILPNYTFQMPDYTERLNGSGDDSDDEEEEPEDAEQHQVYAAEVAEDNHSLTSSQQQDGEEEDEDDAKWVYIGADGEGSDEEGEQSEEEEEDEDEEARHEAFLAAKKQQRKLATKAKSVHVMPAAMTQPVGAESSTAAQTHAIDDDTVTVEVKTLFGQRATPSVAAGGDGAYKAAPALPSQDFSDLPAVVEQELRRLRQDTKGPSRTKSKVHMMKELEKIRKIKKHSRKGHGKRKASGKRKNRRK